MLVRRSTIPLIMLGLLMNFPLWAQETLPKFSLHRLSDDKVLIEWKNTDTTLRQISIQQSQDSLAGFSTILNILDPRLTQNGTVISRPMAYKMFYRIYLLYPQGKYVFTAAKRPDSRPSLAIITEPSKKTSETPAAPITKTNSSTSSTLNQKNLIPSAKNEEKGDTILAICPVIQAKPKIETKKEYETPKPLDSNMELIKFTPSKRIYTHSDGYPYIELPAEWDLAQTQLRFFMENGQPLFELTHPPMRTFRIDKTNFHRSGWYRFEIWLKGKKMETNKLFIPLEF